MIELDPQKKKLTEEFWKTFDKDKFVRETLEKHK